MLMLLNNYAKCANDNGRSKYSKERMIQTRIPPLTKTLVLISDRLALFIVLHVLANGTHMMSHNPLYIEKNL